MSMERGRGEGRDWLRIGEESRGVQGEISYRFSSMSKQSQREKYSCGHKGFPFGCGKNTQIRPYLFFSLISIVGAFRIILSATDKSSDEIFPKYTSVSFISKSRTFSRSFS